MNAQLLIDTIVRQTTVLIAQLATSGGLRAPVAHLANQVFLDLSRELETQGVSRKVSADMFGMALRAYLRKIQRLSESSTEHGRSLWEAVYAFLRAQPTFVSRADVMRRFQRDDEVLMRGVLYDLTETGLVFQTGSGADALLRATTDEELGEMRRVKGARIDELLWAYIYHHGPVTRDELGRVDALRAEDVDGALGRLLTEGRIATEEHPAGTRLFAQRLVVPLGSELGWEAAVLDHFHAMVTTISRKLAGGKSSAADESEGGSTYAYEVWPGHPLEEEVTAALARFRAAHSELRRRVRAHNDALNEIPAGAYRVVIYGGQHVSRDTEEEAS
jgi:hypothetical protein